MQPGCNSPHSGACTHRHAHALACSVHLRIRLPTPSKEMQGTQQAPMWDQPVAAVLLWSLPLLSLPVLHTGAHTWISCIAARLWRPRYWLVTKVPVVAPRSALHCCSQRVALLQVDACLPAL
jgi:hypothetical protein